MACIYLAFTLFICSLLPAKATSDFANPATVTSISRGSDKIPDCSTISIHLANVAIKSDPRTVPASDSLALVDLYNATNGPNWLVKTNWLTGKVNTWYGVTVDSSRVTKIVLYANRLAGTLPATLGNLTAMKYLALSNNELNGSIPANIDKLSALYYLDLGGNRLSGNIPNEIGNLKALIGLLLFNNQLSGSLPLELFNLPLLRSLDLANNQLTGNIPHEVGNLKSLINLLLFGNQLSGSIPSEIGNITGLTLLALGQNQLTGVVPLSLGKLTALTYLDLSSNQLIGGFPEEVANLTALKSVRLANNHLVSLPTFAGNFYEFLVGQNQLTFESLEVNVSKFSSAVTVNYAPQDSVLDGGNQVLPTGRPLKLSALVGGANNRYQWTKNGANIAGATKDSLLVTTTGVYACKITNTLVNNLTLYRRRVQVSSNQKQNQAITFAPLPNKYTIDEPFALSASASSGLPVTYTSSNMAVATVSGNRVTITGNGTTIITASQAGNNTYNPANPVDRPLLVTIGRTVSESDSLALVDFYHSTDGENWRDNYSWLTDNANTWNGVSVENFRVIKLDLSVNRLAGSLPASIGNLTALQTIILDGNELTGSIPATIGNLSDLTFLNLTNNRLTGSIPGELGNLMALQTLSLSRNGLSGSIPDELGNLTALQGLSLFQNQLSGRLPASLGNLIALQYLFLENNQFSGNIPSSLGNLGALKNLFLYSNQLTGSIPVSLGNMKALAILELSMNQLSGSVPVELGNMTGLKRLHLSNNQLSGSIPSEVANLVGLIGIQLTNNQFTSLPLFLGKIDNFLVSHNRLTFESLEANISKLTRDARYAPQDSVGLAENLILPVGASLTLSALVGGANNRYQWTRNGVDIAGATDDSLIVTTEGVYGCKITNTFVKDLTLYRRRANVSLGNISVCQASGSLLREVWTNISGKRVSDIPLLSPPNLSSQLTSLEAPANWGDRYGQRLRGYICAPQTGAYTFWIVSDNGSRLYLSPDADPAHKKSIAYIHNGHAYSGQWTKYRSQKSATINLVAGQRYYLEVLHKEAYGGDNLIVGWSTPASVANATPVIVPGSVLSPFVPTIITACTGTGSILREYWSKVTGTSISAVPLHITPTSTSKVTSFEGPTNVADNYAARYRGYLCAPATGEYRFAIAGDNEVELWLSTSVSASSKQRIAFISNGYTNPRQWTKYPSQQSALVTLQAGQKYYIEALHKESSGGDNLAVGWQTPGSTATFVIPGTYLIPFQTPNAREVSVEEPAVEEIIGLTAYPNPFANEITVKFTTPATGIASLDLYDGKGVRLRPLFEKRVQAGESHQVVVEGSALSNGLYLLRLVNGNKVSHLKVILNK